MGASRRRPLHRALPSWPQARERNPECGVRFVELGAFGLAPYNSQLLSQREVLEGELRCGQMLDRDEAQVVRSQR